LLDGVLPGADSEFAVQDFRIALDGVDGQVEVGTDFALSCVCGEGPQDGLLAICEVLDQDTGAAELLGGSASGPDLDSFQAMQEEWKYRIVVDHFPGLQQARLRCGSIMTIEFYLGQAGQRGYQPGCLAEGAGQLNGVPE
jgi:hypothetical protein